MLNGKELQVGKTYTRRNGSTTKIVGCDGNTNTYPFYDNDGQGYTRNGSFYYSEDTSDLDLMQEVQEQDMVNSPKHYQLFPDSNIEVRDVLKVLADRLGTNGYSGSFIGDYVQLMQYLMRFDMKNGKEDLEKAKFFLDKMVEYKLVNKEVK